MTTDSSNIMQCQVNHHENPCPSWISYREGDELLICKSCGRRYYKNPNGSWRIKQDPDFIPDKDEAIQEAMDIINKINESRT